MSVEFRKGHDIILRPLTRDDASALVKWRNAAFLTGSSTTPFPSTLAEEEERVSYWAKSRASYVFGIQYSDGSLIGTTGLYEIKWPHRTAKSGTLIGSKEHWGQGRATEAKMLLLDFAFNALDLFAVVAHTPDTGREFSHLKKCGYVQAGRVPGWYRDHNGSRIDDVIHFVTQEVWRPLWQARFSGGGIPSQAGNQDKST